MPFKSQAHGRAIFTETAPTTREDGLEKATQSTATRYRSATLLPCDAPHIA